MAQQALLRILVLFRILLTMEFLALILIFKIYCIELLFVLVTEVLAPTSYTVHPRLVPHLPPVPLTLYS